MSDGQEGTLRTSDFLTGGNPSVISIFVNRGFGATSFGLAGALYLVPANRRAFLERIDISVFLAATIPATGSLFIDQAYSPSGGAAQPMKVLEYGPGFGPGTAGLIEPFGHMLAGDSIQLNLTAQNLDAAGNFFRSAFHGIEYDE